MLKSLLVVLAVPIALAAGAQKPSPWMDAFPVNVQELVSEGENPYFILRPGYELTLEGKGTRLVVSVLRETTNIGGVETRVVEERETNNGQPVEVSRNFFAIHPRTKDVYYFGEDVDGYKNGKVDNHEGAWRHGAAGAHFGLMMPGMPAVGQRFYQELAPKSAMDRAEILGLSGTITTPAGTFDHCLTVRETTPLERFSRETKIYAPGIGLVKDGSLTLTRRRQ